MFGNNYPRYHHLHLTRPFIHPTYPHTTLPNLTHLSLVGCGITCQGLIELSQSQLFSQLEELNLAGCTVERWNIQRDQPLPPGIKALLTNSHGTSLKRLNLFGLIELPRDVELEGLFRYDQAIAKHFQHLGNCEIVLK